MPRVVPGRGPKDIRLPETWDRLARETDVQWARFLVYRDSAYPNGPTGSEYRPRSIPAVARELGLDEQETVKQAQNCMWMTRAACYDREIQHARDQSTLTRIQRVRVRQERALDELDEILSLERTKLLHRAMDPEVPCMTVKEQTQLTELVLKHEQLLAGRPTSIVKHEGLDLEDFETEDLEVLDAVVSKYEEKQGVQGGIPGIDGEAPDMH